MPAWSLEVAAVVLPQSTYFSSRRWLIFKSESSLVRSRPQFCLFPNYMPFSGVRNGRWQTAGNYIGRQRSPLSVAPARGREIDLARPRSLGLRGGPAWFWSLAPDWHRVVRESLPHAEELAKVTRFRKTDKAALAPF